VRNEEEGSQFDRSHDDSAKEEEEKYAASSFYNGQEWLYIVLQDC
jgi:hypothetical protein